jgi:hypothetical protein
MHIEDAENVIPTESSKISRLRIKFSHVIAIAGLIVVASTINSVIFSVLPVLLQSPEWQLSLIGTFLSSAIPLLIGSVLICLGSALNHRDKRLENWRNFITAFAAVFSIVLVVILPLQYYCGKRVLDLQATQGLDEINQLNTIKNGLQAVSSELELRSFVASLPNAPALPATFDLPLPALKAKAIESVQSRINLRSNNLEARKSLALQAFLKEAIRNTIQAILMAVAFSSLASLSPKSMNLVTRFFSRFLLARLGGDLPL